jgi:L-alanine-DL-glutamate epimerase-like enolase superfamily enzyme
LVRQQVRAAVATGENLTGLDEFPPLIAAGALDVVQTGSVWGITHFLRVAALAHANDLPISVVGYNTNPLAAAAAAVPNHLTLEVQDLGAPRGLTVDHVVTDGHVVLGDEPGSGLTVDGTQLESPTAEQRWSGDDGPHVRPADAGRRIFPTELP